VGCQRRARALTGCQLRRRLVAAPPVRLIGECACHPSDPDRVAGCSATYRTFVVAAPVAKVIEGSHSLA